MSRYGIKRSTCSSFHGTSIFSYAHRGSVTSVLVLALIGSSGTSGNFSFRTASKRANTSEIWSRPWHGKSSPSKRWFEISFLSLVLIFEEIDRIESILFLLSGNNTRWVGRWFSNERKFRNDSNRFVLFLIFPFSIFYSRYWQLLK